MRAQTVVLRDLREGQGLTLVRDVASVLGYISLEGDYYHVENEIYRDIKRRLDDTLLTSELNSIIINQNGDYYFTDLGVIFYATNCVTTSGFDVISEIMYYHNNEEEFNEALEEIVIEEAYEEVLDAISSMYISPSLRSPFEDEDTLMDTLESDYE